MQYPMPMLTIITLTILIEIALGCLLRLQGATFTPTSRPPWR